jgi:hypothetical protein
MKSFYTQLLFAIRNISIAVKLFSFPEQRLIGLQLQPVNNIFTNVK